MLILKLLSRLPMGLLYALADLLYFVAFYIVRYRKEIVLRNLRNSFPEKNEVEIHQIKKEYYKRFTEYVVETLKGISISEKELLKRVKYTNVDVVQPYADTNQSIIVIASHQFNWEWALQAGCVVLPFPVDAVYKRLSSGKVDKLMQETRARFGGQPIEKSRVLRVIIKTKGRLRALGIVADQSPRQSSAKHWLQFMNQDTAFFLGPEQIAKVAKYPAFFFHVVRVKRGYYTVKLLKLAEPPYEKDTHTILEKYVGATEKLVKNDPAGYMWSHKRWKLKHPLM